MLQRAGSSFAILTNGLGQADGTVCITGLNFPSAAAEITLSNCFPAIWLRILLLGRAAASLQSSISILINKIKSEMRIEFCRRAPSPARARDPSQGCRAALEGIRGTQAAPNIPSPRFWCGFFLGKGEQLSSDVWTCSLHGQPAGRAGEMVALLPPNASSPSFLAINRGSCGFSHAENQRNGVFF